MREALTLHTFHLKVLTIYSKAFFLQGLNNCKQTFEEENELNWKRKQASVAIVLKVQWYFVYLL